MLALHFVALTAAIYAASSHLTCFTCNSSTNEACNRRAIDEPCLIANSICMTTHTFWLDSLHSLNVEKKCVSQCDAQRIGCHLSGHLKICTYCCDKDYCNVNTTLNSKESIAHSRSLLSSSSSPYQSAHLIILILSLNFHLEIF